MRYDRRIMLDGKRTMWLCRLFPDVKLRFNVNQTYNSGSVFEVSLPPLSVEEDYQLFTIDLYDHLLESACELAVMAGTLRRLPFVSDELESRRGRFFDFDFTEPEDTAAETDLSVDVIRIRSHLVRAVKVIKTIYEKSTDELLLQVAHFLEDHLVAVMPELKNVTPYAVPHQFFASANERMYAIR